MLIDVECTECKTTYSVDEQFVGQRVKCRSCGNIFAVAGVANSIPSASADPFENAVFEKPPPKKPLDLAPKLYNPIDPVAEYTKLYEEPEALGRGGINDQPGRERRAMAIGLDSASSTILAVYLLGVLAVGIYATIDISSATVKPGMPSASSLIGHLWGTLITSVVFFFMFVGPMTLLGIWGTSRMMSFPLADSAYFRACAVAALPSVFTFISQLLPLPFNLLILLAAIPVTYYMLTMVFEVTWGEGAVAFILGGAGAIIGGVISVMLLIFVIGVSALTLQQRAQDDEIDAERQKMAAQAAQTNGGGSNSSGALPIPLPQPDRTALVQFSELVARLTSIDLSKSTRDERKGDADVLSARLRQLQPQYHDDPALPALQKTVENFSRSVDALPPAAIDPSVYVNIPDNADEWTTGKLSRGKLAPEVSFKQFKIQTPEDMKLDLTSGEETAQGLVWNGPDNAQLRIFMRPRMNPRQLRPVIAAKPGIRKIADEAGLLAYDGSDVTATVGQINGIPFTKVVVNPTSTGEHFTEYVAAVDKDWLVIHLFMATDGSRVLDAAARTVRGIDDGEADVDPFSPQLLASRLGDDSEHAAPMLRAQGARAEDALLALLRGNDPTLKRRALEILQDIATEKSLLALQAVAGDQDQTNAMLARSAIQRIRPSVAATDANPATTAPADNAAAAPDPKGTAELQGVLADLNSDDAPREKEAVGKLAFLAPTARERPAVQARLAGLLRMHDSAIPVPDLVAALIHWGDASVGADLLPLLKQDGDVELRRAAIRVLGAVKCSAAAPPMARWLKLDPIWTSDALIEMGPGAESAVLPLLGDTDATVQIDAARILERIGTKRSVAELARRANGAGDPGVRAAAQIALTAVNARLADEKPQERKTPQK